MRYTLIFLSLFVLSCSCNEVGNKTKKAINKTGHTIGAAGSELANGIADGVNNTFQSTVTLSDELQKKGISFGKFNVNKDAQTVSVYLIFSKNFKDTIIAKVYDDKWNEYGRSKTSVEGKKDDAQFFDFKFDARTTFEMNSNIALE